MDGFNTHAHARTRTHTPHKHTGSVSALGDVLLLGASDPRPVVYLNIALEPREEFLSVNTVPRSMGPCIGDSEQRSNKRFPPLRSRSWEGGRASSKRLRSLKTTHEFDTPQSLYVRLSTVIWQPRLLMALIGILWCPTGRVTRCVSGRIIYFKRQQCLLPTLERRSSVRVTNARIWRMPWTCEWSV